MKEITFRVPDSMVPLLEEWAKHIPEMEIVSLEESGEYELDEINRRMTIALRYLKETGVIRYGYDYTWIMEASNQTQGMPRFNTPSSFIDYIEKIGIGWVPSEDSINRKQNRFSGKFPEWTFTDCDTTEANRRINVGKRFLNVFRGLL